MFKKIRIAAVLIVVLMACLAQAQDYSNFGLKTHDFGIAFQVYEFDYEEEPDLMGENGTMYGVAAEYTFRDWVKNPSTINWMLRLEGSYAIGKVDYDGQYMDGTPFGYSGIKDRELEIGGLVGLDAFVFNDRALATIYTGLRFRQLDDEASVMPGGYDRRSQHLYLPVGAEIVLEARNNWLITLNGEYNHLLAGKQTSELGILGIPGLGDVENYQKHGNGLRASARFDYINDAGKKKFFIEPFFHLTRVGDSEVEVSGIYAVMEPKNTTRKAGVNIGIPF